MNRSRIPQPLVALIAAVALVGTFLVLVTLGASGPAGAASVQATGWAWASEPTTTSYDALSSYSYNSEGQTNRIERRATGRYTVTFAGLRRAGFEAQVVAHGDGSNFCGLDGSINDGTGGSGSDLLVFVLCLDNIELEPADSRFVASVTGQDGPALNGAGVHFDFDGRFNGYNSSGGGFSWTQVGLGEYDVRIEDQTAAGANVQVTAVSTSPFGKWCNVGTQRQSGSDVLVRVNCWSVQWPSAAQFHLRFTPQQFERVGYALANNAASASYTPSTAFQWQGPSGSTDNVRATRSGPGRYAMRFRDLSGARPTAMVTAFGQDPTRCVVASFSSYPVTVEVRCVSGETNQPADSRYTSWTRVEPPAAQYPDPTPPRPFPRPQPTPAPPSTSPLPRPTTTPPPPPTLDPGELPGRGFTPRLGD